MKLKDLPLALQKKFTGCVDVDGMERIQYYPADLSYALGLQGVITDMHVDIENNIQILRMTVIPTPAEEYKTIRAPKGTVLKPTPQKQPKRPEKKPKSFLEKLVGTNNNTNRRSTNERGGPDWIDEFSKDPFRGR
jgi:hypothetical protein